MLCFYSFPFDPRLRVVFLVGAAAVGSLLLRRSVERVLADGDDALLEPLEERRDGVDLDLLLRRVSVLDRRADRHAVQIRVRTEQRARTHKQRKSGRQIVPLWLAIAFEFARADVRECVRGL